MINKTAYICPKCGESKNIAIMAKVWIGLCQDDKTGDLNAVVGSKNVPDNCPDWDGNTSAKCMDCGLDGYLKNFDANYNAEGAQREFIVDVSRIGYGNCDFVVTAKSLAEAEELAIEKAYSEYYSDHSSDYFIENISEYETTY